MARKSRNRGSHTPVESVRHKDKRTNIPTTELRDFVAEEEKAPKTILYPRDPSLDPQLVWKGKDEQDSHPLEVPAVPIYIQEKIHPQALIENLRQTARAGEQEPELRLFDDFNGLDDFEKKVEFYQHQQNWANRMILGDSLLVMTSLAEKEGLKGKVQMIYMDPPYGIKFGSNWQVSTRKRDVKDGKVEDATREPEQIRAFRDTWKLGIHSYLAYWRDRLQVARDLLTETGSIFVQIGDENVHVVRCVLDEVFGSDNFVCQIAFRKTLPLGSAGLGAIYDTLLWYAKDRPMYKYHGLFMPKDVGEGTLYRTAHTEEGVGGDRAPESGVENLRFYTSSDLKSSGYTESCTYDFEFRGRVIPAQPKSWRTHVEGMHRLIAADRLLDTRRIPRYIQYASDFPVQDLTNLWVDTIGASDMVFVVQTATKVVERCILMATDPGDLVLDPTCGSGTTAFVAEQWGRRWITIDTSRVALTLARTRLMSARYPYYLLADSPEGIMKEAEITGRVPPSPLPQTEGDIRKGFVYKRVPHITLKSIANNEEIDEIHARWQERLEPIRARLNKAVKQNWEEWEIPRLPSEYMTPEEQGRTRKNLEAVGIKPGSEAENLLKEWWALRRQRQKELDDSIARHADTELLYDQPYEDNKRIRVSGPFTVESLSPHRVLSTDDERPASEAEAQTAAGPGQFETMIIENLRKAGVQNMVKQERLKFERLEAYPGLYLQAAGDYTEGGKPKRVAVCIGPEHGTVGPDLVKEAAKEALQGVGFDLLLVCGFAFDPHAGEAARQFSPETLKRRDEFAVAEAAKQYGKLPVLLVRINADLAMGDEFLKRTGAANLFMVFGEPDIEIRRDGDGKVVVEIKGVDVYDPTTGQIRSHSTDDIACWFIDTNYDGESFFVRHAYFCGADEPYEKLKRALKAEIDEAAWATLYSTTSRPFDPPETGKIAIKVINHYGDEVLKVYEVGG